MTTPATAFDRAAAVRRALRTLVARHGLHGASMSAVAKQAGVATGTAYVHYESKEQLLFAAYLEVKREMGEAVHGAVDITASARDRFLQLWMAVYRFHALDPDRARFMVQIDSSPYARHAHELAMAVADDPVMAQASAPDLAGQLAPLDLQVLYDLGIAPAVRFAANVSGDDVAFDDETLARIAEACWRAISLG